MACSVLTCSVLTHIMPHSPCVHLQQENVRYTRKHDDVRPFEAGGEASLEHFATKADCGLFALASHSKKRPHNLTLGRMYNGHLYDLLEVGVSSHTPISAFQGAALAQAGNKVRCRVPHGLQTAGACLLIGLRVGKGA